MKDGGAAFPRPASQGQGIFKEPDNHQPQDGMTLRDWFAGQALAGYMADPEVEFNREGDDFSAMANDCYKLADAMLAEREKGGSA